MVKMACRQCKRIIEGKECPVCRTSDLTRNFQGMIVIFDTDSEIAKKLEISAPGTYAIKA